MKENLNHLVLFDKYISEKKDIIKEIGKNVRKGLGFLTYEEKIEKGLGIVKKHKVKKDTYEILLKQDPERAEKYLIFWAELPDGFPHWNSVTREWEDSGEYYDQTGIVGTRKY